MSRTISGSTMPRKPLATASPASMGWLFFFIGPCFLVPIYWQHFRPVQQANGWHFFQPVKDDLLLGSLITTLAFSGAGAAILANRKKLLATAYDKTLQQLHADKPWKWRRDWEQRRVSPEVSHGQGIAVAWAVLCLLAAWPAVELWKADGWGTPDDANTGIGAFAVAAAILTAFLAARSWMRRRRSKLAILHLAAETGIIGGPLEGGVELRTPIDEVLVRLVLERHWIMRRKTSDGTTVEHKVALEYEDTYRANLTNGFLPIRFAVPYNKAETSREHLTPVYFWFVELEQNDGTKILRFQVPVFKTEQSREDFELGKSAVDSSIEEEEPEEILRRHGISITVADQQNDAVQTIDVPPLRAPSLTFALLFFGVTFLGVAVGMLLNGSSIFLYLFIVVFGGVGLLLTLFALPMLFERRRVEFDNHSIRIRKSYFGFGWTRSLSWDDVKSIDISGRQSGSAGHRKIYKSVVASTEGASRVGPRFCEFTKCAKTEG